MSNFLCLEIALLDDPLSLVLPGGITIEAMNLIDIVQPALAPFGPVFAIVDAIIAVFNCVKAIPDALGPPPDPSAIAKCVPELAKKVDKLLALIPVLSVPIMLRRLLELVIQTLKVLRDALLHLKMQLTRITAVIERAKALNDKGLMAIGQCAEANVAIEVANHGKGLGTVGRLLSTIQIFSDLLGGPKIPNLSTLVGKPIDQALKPLDAIVTTLKTVHDAIPVP